ncbi:MAG: autotransporter-associated beta strand repeat-containing protein, partial [Verrucomicrobia bacterium]|nr:autotransporter-associated beta strand repeat-containing protein [Verrucomicrobiota bacterium]
FLVTDGANAVNMNGATLQSSLTHTAILPATLQVSVNGAFGTFAGGAVVDTAGFDDTFAAALLAPAGNGVGSIPVATQGDGYIGAPYVSITGTGSGATAIAEMTDDLSGNGTLKVSAIKITNPGINYTAAPTVTLSGGAPTTAATIGTVTVAANTAGSLVKLSVGTLTLSGANTYTGTTTVSNGALHVTGSLAGGVDAKSGAILTGNGVVGGAVIVDDGATLQPGLGGTDSSPLAINNSLTLSNTATAVIAINNANTPNASTLTGITTLAAGGTLTVTNVGGVLAANDSFNLFSVSGGVSGAFSATNLPTLAGNQNWWSTNNGATLVVNQTRHVFAGGLEQPADQDLEPAHECRQLLRPDHELGERGQQRSGSSHHD